MGQFGFGQPVLRREDSRLVTGVGRFIDDEAAPGLAQAVMLRSPHGHARIDRLDVAAARRAPGVLLVLTAADIRRGGLGKLACLTRPSLGPGSPYAERLQPLLVDDVARYVGDGVAFVVAETLGCARDAAELVEVDYTPLPAVLGADRAGAPDAALVWPDVPGNLSFVWELGDRAATQAAFAKAAHVVKRRFHNNRVMLSAMETRGALAEYDLATGKFTLTATTQMPNHFKTQLWRDVLKVPQDKVRVLVHDVGGGFGGKNSLQPEQPLALHAARLLGRPVKWLAERTEAFVSDFQGRDNVLEGELALDAEGRILAIRAVSHADLGAYMATRGHVSPVNGFSMLANSYAIPAVHAEVRAVYTNTVPTDPYRGAGRPEVLYMVERLLDEAAVELGLDRVELRRRNLIPVAAFPYKTPTGLTYEASDFAALMEAAQSQADWAGFKRRQGEALKRGRLRGIGMANYIERCGGGGGLAETARLEVAADGAITLLIGTQSNGQGHETAYSQIIAERFGLPFEQIRIVQGDTDRIASGVGTGGSWSIPMGGGALSQAADKVIDKARAVAGQMLEAAIEDIGFADGLFRVLGTDLKIGWADVAQRAAAVVQGGLDDEARYAPDNHTFPYGCHIAEVEIDPESGEVALLGYSCVHDFGRVLNPLLLAGQVHGGLAQGIGQALSEHTVYGEDGQLLSGSFMDYCIPRAADLPAFRFLARETPNPRNPLGVKGCGEAGAAGSPPAVMNAVMDALALKGVRQLDMPATPSRVWAALRAATR